MSWLQYFSVKLVTVGYFGFFDLYKLYCTFFVISLHATEYFIIIIIYLSIFEPISESLDDTWHRLLFFFFFFLNLWINVQEVN